MLYAPPWSPYGLQKPAKAVYEAIDQEADVGLSLEGEPAMHDPAGEGRLGGKSYAIRVMTPECLNLERLTRITAVADEHGARVEVREGAKVRIS
jgi:hypothetical protein